MTDTSPIALETPRITVILGDEDDPTTWERHTIRALNPDLCAWDESAARHKWPAATVAAFPWLTFLAWRVCRRKGLIPKDEALTAFRDRTLSVTPYTDPDEDPEDSDDTARPTQPGPDPG